MQVSVETTADLGRKMTVQVPAERIENEIEKRLRDLCGRVKMDGFRPGKVPLKVVRRQYGRRVREEVVGEVLRESYREALQEQGLRPVGVPSVEPRQDESGQDLIYEASFEVMPELEITGVETIQVERPQVEITAGDVDNVLERLRRQHAEFDPVERGAESGDQVVIDFTGTVDGESFPGHSATDAAIVIGAGQLPDEFEQALHGAVAGEERSFEYTFPEQVKTPVAGKTAQFTVQIKRVDAPRLPPLDDALAERFGIEEGGLEALREAVSANLQKERDQAVRHRLKRQVLEQLAERNPVDLPDSLVNSEIEVLCEQSGGTAAELSAEERAGYAEQARKRVHLGLLVNELVRREQIELDRERMVRELQQMVVEAGGGAELLQQYVGNQRLMESMEASVIEEQTVDWLLERVQQQERAMSFEQLLGAGASPAEGATAADTEEERP
ncbi:trigger factor [Halorhodospira abdelmalekii]|uniref:trigger factor n=1 Tax=Halorhodospira abdelmalekii TaxID=421629 RepID=UPI001905431D|nr:trigger factor [Halorhodospira abdelmalekii]MBK1736075.1 trigger factor [Halorhodospira abdelmalekii]